MCNVFRADHQSFSHYRVSYAFREEVKKINRHIYHFEAISFFFSAERREASVIAGSNKTFLVRKADLGGKMDESEGFDNVVCRSKTRLYRSFFT